MWGLVSGGGLCRCSAVPPQTGPAAAVVLWCGAGAGNINSCWWLPKPLPCDCSLEVHEWSVQRQTATSYTMFSLALTLVSLVAAAAAQEEAKETPLWFLEEDLDGTFSQRSGACPGLLAAKQDEASFGPIFIPEDKEANICIRFPARDGRPETWRHDLGGKGACANQCCEFKPPLKNPPPPSPQPTWFETFNGDCSNTAAAFNGPTLFRGKDLDAKSICFQLEDGSYELREGFLGNCGGPCCIFYGEAAERK